MEKTNSYETLFIVDASLADDAIKALTEKFTALIAEHGTISEVNEWGKRRLAYPIDDKEEGYYVLVQFQSGAEFPAELERIFGITDGIMRSIVIRQEEVKKAAAQA
ncbi:MAG: 30S ribosomal protein S6 [Eubacteriales bacterium]